MPHDEGTALFQVLVRCAPTSSADRPCDPIPAGFASEELEPSGSIVSNDGPMPCKANVATFLSGLGAVFSTHSDG